MIKNIYKISILLVTMFCVVGSALAWDDTGHKVTAYIAWQRMTPEVRDRVIKILLSAPEDSQIATFYLPYGSRQPETKKREFFMLMASWPDIIRDKSFETRFKKYANSNWHYADTFWKFEDGKVVFVDNVEPSGLAMQKLNDFDKLIRGSGPDSDKAVAIAWLEHLIGDIHQPLHMSGKVSDSNPKGDQGGNLFLLTPKGTPRDKQLNLHSFWDSIIAQNEPNIKDRCDADYIDPIADAIIKKFPYDNEKAKLNKDRFELWGKESLDIATSFVYRDIKFFELPTENYKKNAFEIAQERMALAGYRMGDLFNEVFSAPASNPPATSK